MLRKILLLSVFVFAAHSVFPQFKVMHPSPFSTSFTSSFFTSPITGYVTTSSQILRTNDAGLTWDTLKTLPSGYFANIVFTDANTGYIASTYGTLYKTINAGKDWTVTTPVAGLLFLNSLCFTDPNTGYMVGKAAVLKTTDAGATWNKLTMGTGSNFNKIYFYDQNVGFALGDNGIIYKTTNAGSSWDSLKTGLDYSSGSYLKSIYFINSTTGFACGYPGMIKTTDGGNTWTKAGTYTNLSIINFSSATNGTVLGSSTLKTTDGGATWQSTNTNTSYSYVSFVDANTAFGFGSWGAMGKTNDGGKTWIANSPMTDNHCIWFTDANTGYMGASEENSYNNDRIMKTADGGKTWKTLDTSTAKTGYIFTKIRFTDLNTGYAIGSVNNSTAVVLKTTDAGSSWNKLNTNNLAGSFYAIQFVNASTGYIAGSTATYSNPVILKTADAGATWTNLTYPGADPIKSIYFTDASTGYAAAGKDYVYKTTDGGTTWNKVTLTFNAYAVYFTDANTGFLAGKGIGLQTGFVYKTTDAGATWTACNGNSYYELYHLVFTDASNGYAVGRNGEIMTTNDGGAKWTAQETPFHYRDEREFNDISASPVKTVYTVSRHGLLLYAPAAATSGVEDKKESFLPGSFALGQNYPNPFNPSTTINYQIPQDGIVTLKIFDVLGREISTLVNEFQNKGNYSVSFNGSGLASGIYVYQLRTSGSSSVKKMMLAK